MANSRCKQRLQFGIHHDMVSRSRLLAAHGLLSCLSVRTQPLTATGAPSQTSTIPYHTIPYRRLNSVALLDPLRSVQFSTIQTSTIPYHTIPYHTIPYRQPGRREQRCTFSSTTFRESISRPTSFSSVQLQEGIVLCLLIFRAGILDRWGRHYMLCHGRTTGLVGTVWYGMVEVCEGGAW